LLGLDDTDVLGRKPGTGRLARELGAHLQASGMAELVGVVRQQLLVDPRIPYTSHNSPACIILETAVAANGGPQGLFDAAAAFVSARYAAGADPGLCLADRDAVSQDVRAFGLRAASSVVGKRDALEIGARAGVMLAELGGTGDGVIGALAGVGLTADGNAGRWLEWRTGLRDRGARLTAGALRAEGITVLSIARNGEPVPAEAWIEIGERLRPRMIGSAPVLLVEPADGGWRCFDRRLASAEERDAETE
jgi:hypothetical protein